MAANDAPPMRFGEAFLIYYERQRKLDHDARLQHLQAHVVDQRAAVDERSTVLEKRLRARELAAHEPQRQLHAKRRELWDRYARPPMDAAPPLPRILREKPQPPAVLETRVPVHSVVVPLPVKALPPRAVAVPCPIQDKPVSLARASSASLDSPVASQTAISNVFATKQAYDSFRKRWMDDGRLQWGQDGSVESDSVVDEPRSSHAEYLAEVLRPLDEARRQIRQGCYRGCRQKRELLESSNRAKADAARIMRSFDASLSGARVSANVNVAEIPVPEVLTSPVNVESPAQAEISADADESTRVGSIDQSSRSSAASAPSRPLPVWEPLSLGCLASHRHMVYPSNNTVGGELQRLSPGIRSTEQRILFWQPEQP